MENENLHDLVIANNEALIRINERLRNYDRIDERLRHLESVMASITPWLKIGTSVIVTATASILGLLIAILTHTVKIP